MIKMLRVYDPPRWRMIGCKTGITYVIVYPRVEKKCEGFVIKCTADATRRTALGKFPSTIYRSMSGDRGTRRTFLQPRKDTGGSRDLSFITRIMISRSSRERNRRTANQNNRDIGEVYCNIIY